MSIPAAYIGRWRSVLVVAAAVVAAISVSTPVLSFAQTFDAAWYNPTAPYVKIAVVEDGVYRVTGSDLLTAGVPIGSVDPNSIRILEAGTEIPVSVSSTGPSVETGDFIDFVGHRNTGSDEAWAYNELPENMSSVYNSLYSDTTHYWLTWGGPVGRRYQSVSPPAGAPPTVDRTRAHLRIEDDIHYYPGDGSSAGNPIYTRAEGYYHSRIRHNTSQADITVPLAFSLVEMGSASSDSVRIEAAITSETVSRHKVILEVGLADGGGVTMTRLDSSEWVGISSRVLRATVPQSLLPSDGSLAVTIRSRNNYSSATPNNMLLDWVSVDYARLTRPTSDRLLLFTEPGTRVYGIGNMSAPAVAYRPNADERFSITPVGNAGSFELSAAAPDPVYVTQNNAYRSPAAIAIDDPSSLVAPMSGGAQYVILTTASLRASAEAMAAHRASVAGGGYSTLVVDVQDVFDQFDYGRPTPIAIRRFVRAARVWDIPIIHLVIWGDALYANKNRARPLWEVPSFGHTVSDGWFAMQNNGLTDYAESIGIGRLPVRTNAQGMIVVAKMQSYEGAPIDLWQKNATFLAGGFTDSERNRLRQSARRWSSLVASRPATLDTTHYFKKSANVLDPSFKDSIQANLRNGVSWLVYFGHSATQTWEIVTDPPALFDNASMLPIILSLGCFTGDFATGTGDPGDILSFSEQLVVESPNGSIAHWGASSSGTIGASERFSDEVHQSVFTDSLRVLGLAIKAAKDRYNSKYSDPISVKHLLQYGLIGDPATRISLPDDVDLRIQPEDIRVTPFAPVPSDDELIASVTVRNIGLFPADTILAEVRHVLPDGSSRSVLQEIPPFRNEAPIEVRLPINDASVGQNTVRVALDVEDALAEMSEVNNDASQAVTVFSSGLAIAEPARYALYPSTDVSLIVNTSAAGVADPAVLFELDTLSTFSSGALATARVVSSELTAEWAPADLLDEQRYYWRARIDEPGQEDIWSEGSFTIRSSLGESGWYQSGPQLGEDAVSPTLETWNDGWSLKTFTIDASASSENGAGLEKGQFVVNGQFYERLELGFGLLLIDGTSATVKASAAGATYANDFDDPVQSVADLQAVAALAEPGDYVLTRTRHLANRDGEILIPDSIRAIFRGLGSEEIDNITYYDLWIMFGKIGAPEETREFVIPASAGALEVTERFSPEFRFTEGDVTSPSIGPVSRWNRVAVESESTSDGEVVIDVLDPSGTEVVVGALTAPFNVELPASARDYPFLKLQATLRDSTRLSTPQLINWRVSYNPVPELALDPAGTGVSPDSVAVGSPITASAALRNLSDLTADTVVVTYQIIDEDNRTTLAASDTLFAVSTSASSEVTLATDGFVGSNRLRIEVSQPGLVEPITVNNVALLPFKVSGDETAPTFTVVVDGELLPDDPNPVVNLQDPALPFVSARPQIDISVEDDFGFLDFDSDSMAVEVILDDEPVAPALLSVQFADNRRRLEVSFTPDFSARDSTHTLRVLVRDARGNAAIDSPYQTHFRVQNAVELEETYPYPNPMSSSTRFAFRLRGADATLVDDLVLRIYTVSGRLIRELDLINEPSLLESGGLSIGWNKVLWDGRDSDGDEVATGVYLYRIHGQSEGSNLGQGAVERIAVIR